MVEDLRREVQERWSLIQQRVGVSARELELAGLGTGGPPLMLG
jgi:hypothetical protein